MRVRLILPRCFTHLALLCVVALWMLPTLGLFVSSLRTNDQITNTGWWTATETRTVANMRRTAGSQSFVREGAKFVLRGRLFPEGYPVRIQSFSLSAFAPDANPVGSTAEVLDGAVLAENDGLPDGTLTVQADTTYRLELNGPYTADKGVRVFYVAQEGPTFTLKNYQNAAGTDGLGEAFFNTFKVALPATFLTLLVGVFAAYALSWMPIPGRNAIMLAIVGLLVVPMEMSLIPLLRMYNAAGEMLGIESKAYLGVWLIHTAFSLPFAIFFLRNFFSLLPRELIESGRLDGASHWQILWHIVLPLSVPALASFAVFQFLWVWNDYLIALIFLGTQPDQIVLTIKLRNLLGCTGYNWEILPATAFIAFSVPLLVFFTLQRYFQQGLIVVVGRTQP